MKTYQNFKVVLVFQVNQFTNAETELTLKLKKFPKEVSMAFYICLQNWSIGPQEMPGE